MDKFRSDPLFFQRLMKSCGMYSGALDGKWGPMTEASYEQFVKNYKLLQQRNGALDDQSETSIATLLPRAQVEARKFMQRAASFRLGVKILSGTRTYAEQNALYAQGRSTRGSVVTNAKGGQSNHNFGIAFDVGIFEGKKYYTGRNALEERAYTELREWTKDHTDLEWGGDWKSIVDKPHYQLVTGLGTKEVRARLEKGERYA